MDKIITEEVLAIVKNNKSHFLEISFLPIDQTELKFFENTFKNYWVEFETANEVAKRLIKDSRLTKYFLSFDYCKKLHLPYQRIPDIISDISKMNNQHILQIYSSIFNNLDETGRTNRIEEEKVELYDDCITRIKAFILQREYEKVENDKDIKMYSHRKIGWSDKPYQFNEHFSIQIRTNFGYGSVSYFYTIIKYKDLEITPYADWLKYPFAQISEIMFYSSRHDLKIQDWIPAMNYICNAHNIALKDDEVFMQIYVIEQLNEFSELLVKLYEHSNKLESFPFFNHLKKITKSKYSEFELIEFKSNKIVNSLDFIPHINKFRKFIEVEKYIKTVETINIKFKPEIQDAKGKIKFETSKLQKIIEDLEIKFESSQPKFERFEAKMQKFKRNNNLKYAIAKESFKEINQDYKDFIELYEKLKSELFQRKKELGILNSILENLEKDLKKNIEYFEVKTHSII